MSPSTLDGLLGICLSGAGPTILALSTKNFEVIATNIMAHFTKQGIECEWRLLEPAEGTKVVRKESTGQ